MENKHLVTHIIDVVAKNRNIRLADLLFKAYFEMPENNVLAKKIEELAWRSCKTDGAIILELEAILKTEGFCDKPMSYWEARFLCELLSIDLLELKRKYNITIADENVPT